MQKRCADPQPVERAISHRQRAHIAEQQWQTARPCLGKHPARVVKAAYAQPQLAQPLGVPPRPAADIQHARAGPSRAAKRARASASGS